jgi:small subunit ribosomal protein S1
MVENDNDMSFADLFEASDRLAMDAPLVPGEPVRGKVVLITGDTVFIDYGAKSEGWADLEEFTNDNGEVTVKPGMEVELGFIGFGPSGAQLGNCLRKVSGGAGLEMVRKAFDSGIAIEGTVTGTNKGGLEINVSGIKAFCPFSQMDLTYLDNPAVFIGTTHKFKVTQFEDEGKNIVLSRRMVLKAEKEALAMKTRERLEVKEVFKGQVTRLTPFGAFIDLGGIEGLVHISEITRGQVTDPADHLVLGQEVAVQVLEIKTDEKGQERISLSIKALEPDLWETGLGFEEGDILIGKVRNLAPFGAFVEIVPGIDGLVHISEISPKRIRHPKEMLKEGQEVEVKVLEINTEQRRISLSIKEAAPFSGPEIEFPEQELIRTGNVIRRRVKTGTDHDSLDPFEDNVRLAPELPPDTLSPPTSVGPRLPQVGIKVKGIIRSIKPYGIFIDLPELGPHQSGLLHKSQMDDLGRNQVPKGYKERDEIQVEIIKIDDQGRISLSQKSVSDSQDQSELKEYRDRTLETGKLGTMADLFKKKK